MSNLRDARNTLTQRIFAYYSSTIPTNAVIKMETDSMDDGDITGLAIFQNPYAFIEVKQTNGQKYVIKVNNRKTVDSTLIYSSTIYLKAQATYGTSQVSFAYGLNDQSIKKLGNTLSMKFDLSIFTGNKFSLFNYATIQTGGFVDFDWFRIDWNKLTGVNDEEDLLSKNKLQFSLEQNYPNPFNPSTTISYQLPVNSTVTLKLYNNLGQEIETLIDKNQDAGFHSIQFTIDSRLASGVYFYRLSTNEFYQTKKMMLIK